MSNNQKILAALRRDSEILKLLGKALIKDKELYHYFCNKISDQDNENTATIWKWLKSIKEGSELI